MPVTFDGANKLMICTSGTTYLDVQIDLYSASKEWLLSNAHWPPPFSDAIGGQALGSDKYAGRTYFLGNGWKIKPDTANHTLILEGNLFRDPADNTPSIIAEVPGYSVLVQLRSSIEAQGVATSGSGGATPAQIWSYNDRTLSTSGVNAITTAVWGFVTSAITTTGSAARHLTRLAKIHGLTAANVTASTIGRSTSDGDVNQTITDNAGTKTMSGDP